MIELGRRVGGTVQTQETETPFLYQIRTNSDSTSVSYPVDYGMTKG